MFLKVILYFCAFSFCSKCIFVFFFKTGSDAVSQEACDLELPVKCA